MIGRLLSPLTRRILIVNILPLAILVSGILYSGEYRKGLIATERAALKTQAEILAHALRQGAIGTEADGTQVILFSVVQKMLRRLTAPTWTSARFFDANGVAIAGSMIMFGPGPAVQVELLMPADDVNASSSVFKEVYDQFVEFLLAHDRVPPFPGKVPLSASDVPIAAEALNGEAGTAHWSRVNGMEQIGAAAPVQRPSKQIFKKVFGAVFLTANLDNIDAAVRAFRFDILKVFAVVLALTVMLSLYLAGAIARPVRRLAAAADRVRHGHGEANEIPDFTRRRDEIGDLSASLRDMTEALWQRIEANESFAADVAHEIANPLASLRSAVETVARVNDPVKQLALMDIIQDDVKRLDRLISDISDASRLDAELARGEMESVDLGRLIPALVQVHETALVQVHEGSSADDAGPQPPRLVFRGGDAGCAIWGNADRLVQVFQNLISNARSFTPSGGEISLSVRRDRRDVLVQIDDQGPGIPVDSLDSIFERFYSERPSGESFGRHSGLGLSISRQIVEAHGGTIHAENIQGSLGKQLGARLVVRLPAAGS